MGLLLWGAESSDAGMGRHAFSKPDAHVMTEERPSKTPGRQKKIPCRERSGHPPR